MWEFPLSFLFYCVCVNFGRYYGLSFSSERGGCILNDMRRPPIPGLVMADSWLAPFTKAILERQHLFDWRVKEIRNRFGSLDAVSQKYDYFGLNFDKVGKKWIYREWAPSAAGLWLTGDFNDWNRSSHPLIPTEKGGVWEITLAEDVLTHGQKFKVHVLGNDGSRHDRIPAYAKYVVQDEKTCDFSAQVWCPTHPYEWMHSRFDVSRIKVPFIYEAHTGMAGEEARIHGYREFADDILPWVKACHYNVIQLMAVQEHPYYGSFGYHVSSFFAPSSRFGTPDDLKYLVDKAHGLGIAVLLDVVHSHAVKNVAEGLNNFDGSNGQYFHIGDMGTHPDWDSKCFDYGRDEVLSFLLSNVRWWLAEYHFDGFRFDGVTSMLYTHRGHAEFSGYDSYFNSEVDRDAVVYLQLANKIMQRVRPGAFSIAEDMSGMPGLCRPVDEGGLGFTHRLAMGIPDFWIKMIKEQKDEDWNMGDIWYTLTNRRYGEPHIAYAESHDQALVGDKTLAFRLMDAAMYSDMLKTTESLVVDRGMALHKMIRLISLSVGGEGWLNFMGNEFGHPEWIDFPREGNDWSYKYCRRQWSLVHNENLRYQYLGAFDAAMIEFAEKNALLSAPNASVIHMDEENKIMVYERGGYLFLFNWSADKAISDYKFVAPQQGTWKIALDSDESRFGGCGRLDHSVKHFTEEDTCLLSVYLLPRSAMVLKKV